MGDGTHGAFAPQLPSHDDNDGESDEGIPRALFQEVGAAAGTLEQFALSLSSGQLRAVTVDPPECGLEGSWWLCEILGPASQATARQAHATDLFEEGWWIVRIKWYKCVPDSSPRRYTLLQNSTRWLSVSAIIRVDGLEFEGGQRVVRSGERLLSDGRASLIGECQ